MRCVWHALAPPEVVVYARAAEKGETHAVAVRFAKLDRLLQICERLILTAERGERLCVKRGVRREATRKILYEQIHE